MLYLSEYTWLSRLGQGTFGDVHKFRDAIGRDVAVKRFYQDRFPPDKWGAACANAIGEAQQMQALAHKNVVAVHQVVASENHDELAIVMECCEQGAVTSLPRSNKIRLREAKRIVCDAGIGLVYIHNSGYIHRDIKPDNILRSEDGLIKVSDFGLVTDDLVLGYAAAAGTPYYLAPECFDRSICSQVTDVYSLGATFIHMTHGDLWLRRGGVGAMIAQNARGYDELCRNYLFLPHVPIRWRNVMKGMTHRDPARRYRSMDAAVDAICGLPDVPDWLCSVEADVVRWERTVGPRRHRVEWHNYLRKGEVWTAWTENEGGLVRRRLAQSVAGEKHPKPYRSLQEFFDRYN